MRVNFLVRIELFVSTAKKSRKQMSVSPDGVLS